MITLIFLIIIYEYAYTKNILDGFIFFKELLVNIYIYIYIIWEIT